MGDLPIRSGFMRGVVLACTLFSCSVIAIAADDSKNSATISPDEKAAASPTEWWSLKPFKRPAVPVVANQRWRIRNPIDAFILAKLEEKGLVPSPEADRRTLIRRLYFDLIGLPPTPEQIESFIYDPDQNAYDHVVDQ